MNLFITEEPSEKELSLHDEKKIEHDDFKSGDFAGLEGKGGSEYFLSLKYIKPVLSQLLCIHVYVARQEKALSKT